ncbi:MAG: N-6 DNA methylase, partial [Imperialibacter sp.]
SSDGQLLFLMEMVSKMKPLNMSLFGSRIASVHNGSSLFTGDAGGGESNIRRYIIENDLLDAIIQMPNNLFYNTGITTYIWMLTNNKPAQRKGKVQLIDASQRYEKLRKNLGSKNCEFKPHHIREIIEAYNTMEPLERAADEDLASQVFDNSDFGYYKVTIERPKRLKAQFSEERLASLRFDKKLLEPMQYAWETYGDRVYTELKALEKELTDWCEAQELDLNTKQTKALVSKETWQTQLDLLQTAQTLMAAIGTEEYNDFNVFRKEVDAELKASKTALSASQKKQILDAVSWYASDAAKVAKGIKKLKRDALNELLERWKCREEDLPNYGLYATGKPGEYLEYETESDLRDYENIPLKEGIYTYFLREVKPQVAEAWINIETTKIGYEISFNKYFYRHKPLRSIEEVSADILQLERESEGLILEILNLN